MGLKTLILSTHFYVFYPFVHIPHGTEEKGEPVFSWFYSVIIGAYTVMGFNEQQSGAHDE
eukprot:scaffold51555_cov59-Attheya_sp.AAC.1